MVVRGRMIMVMMGMKMRRMVIRSTMEVRTGVGDVMGVV